MRSIWTGSIGFGLVNIPIKLYSAIESSSLDLSMLDKNDLSNIRFKRVNENTGKEVPYDNIVKGYKYEDRYIVVDSEDFEKAMPEKTSHIDIIQFVDIKQIDVVYYETPYFIQPDKGGTRAYALLEEGLAKTGKAGLGSFVMRDKEHTCLIMPYNDLLILQRLRWAQEIRDSKELKVDVTKNKANELEMAVSLIKQLTKPVDLTKFKDEYSDKLLDIIQAKAKGKKTPYKPMKIVHSTDSDLMAQLKASLGKPKKKAS
jgi:DNA end-binding protein Ku